MPVPMTPLFMTLTRYSTTQKQSSFSVPMTLRLAA